MQDTFISLCALRLQTFMPTKLGIIDIFCKEALEVLKVHIILDHRPIDLSPILLVAVILVQKVLGKQNTFFESLKVNEAKKSVDDLRVDLFVLF